MTDEYVIERQDAPGHGRYHIALPGGLEAEMTYRKVGADTIVIDHTYTPPEFRGHNIAFLLLSRGIADARAEGKKVVPECSYAVVQFKRHTEWEDLLAV